MNWNILENEAQLDEIVAASYKQPIMILKHSTTCSISATALSRLERAWNEEKAQNLKPYYLDLLKLRPISNKIANLFNVQHESPQILLIKDGKSIYNASHFDIQFDEIIKYAA